MRNDISMIVAMGLEGSIGKGGKLPWHPMKADMQRFKRLTMGNVLLMGRRTFESIGKPLAGRHTVVVSSYMKELDGKIDGLSVVQGFDNGLCEALRIAKERKCKVFLAGGLDIYRAGMFAVDEIHVTHVHHVSWGADIYFPPWPTAYLPTFRVEGVEYVGPDDNNIYPSTYIHLVKRNIEGV